MSPAPWFPHMILRLRDKGVRNSRRLQDMKATAGARKVNTADENSLCVRCSKLFHRAYALIRGPPQAFLQPFLRCRSLRKIQLNELRDTQHGRNIQIRNSEFLS